MIFFWSCILETPKIKTKHWKVKNLMNVLQSKYQQKCTHKSIQLPPIWLTHFHSSKVQNKTSKSNKSNQFLTLQWWILEARSVKIKILKCKKSNQRFTLQISTRYTEHLLAVTSF